jgi:hypothetical protein
MQRANGPVDSTPMTDPTRNRVSSVMQGVTEALKKDLRHRWPGAAIEYDGALKDGYGIWIRAAGSKYRLEIGQRATWHATEQRGEGTSLITALRGQRWIEFLLVHRCGFVGMDENGYVLGPCPSSPEPSVLRLPDL